MTPTQSPTYQNYNIDGITYYHVAKYLSWTDSSYCIKNGMQFAIIRDEKQQDSISKKFVSTFFENPRRRLFCHLVRLRIMNHHGSLSNRLDPKDGDG